jgi:hypothetical protein
VTGASASSCRSAPSRCGDIHPRRRSSGRSASSSDLGTRTRWRSSWTSHAAVALSSARSTSACCGGCKGKVGHTGMWLSLRRCGHNDFPPCTLVFRRSHLLTRNTAAPCESLPLHPPLRPTSAGVLRGVPRGRKLAVAVRREATTPPPSRHVPPRRPRLASQSAACSRLGNSLRLSRAQTTPAGAGPSKTITKRRPDGTIRGLHPASIRSRTWV